MRRLSSASLPLSEPKGRVEGFASYASYASLGLLLCVALSLPAQAALPTPEQFAGFRMGEEGKLVRWEKIVEYFNLADKESDRVVVQQLGKSTLGNPFIMAIVSSPANLARLDEIKATQRRLAYPYDLAPEEAARLARSTPVVLLITLNIHSTEIGSTQMSLELIRSEERRVGKECRL